MVGKEAVLKKKLVRNGFFFVFFIREIHATHFFMSLMESKRV